MIDQIRHMFLGFSVTAACALSLHSTERPNILIFLIDDMGLMDTSVPFLTEGGTSKIYPLNERYRTPTMEQLAEQGLRFERYYANSVCSPSRLSLITGQNSARHRTTQWINPYGRNTDRYAPTDWNWPGLREDSVTLPGLLSSAGYQTIHVGKAHWGPLDHAGSDPLRIGFDRNVAGAAWGRPGSYYGTQNFTNAQQLRQPPHLEAYHGEDIHLTEALTNEMLKQLDSAHATGKPIFAHMAFYAVHGPFEADPQFLANYPGDQPGKTFAAMIEAWITQSDVFSHIWKYSASRKIHSFSSSAIMDLSIAANRYVARKQNVLKVAPVCPSSLAGLNQVIEKYNQDGLSQLTHTIRRASVRSSILCPPF